MLCFPKVSRADCMSRKAKIQTFELLPLQLLQESCFLGNTDFLVLGRSWNRMQSQWLSKMINLHALVLRPSLPTTALTMSYCQLSWGREQQFSYNAAFTTSRPAEQKCRFSAQFHIFLNATIDCRPHRCLFAKLRLPPLN